MYFSTSRKWKQPVTDIPCAGFELFYLYLCRVCQQQFSGKNVGSIVNRLDIAYTIRVISQLTEDILTVPYRQRNIGQPTKWNAQEKKLNISRWNERHSTITKLMEISLNHRKITVRVIS